MNPKQPQLILSSKSPRRRELFSLITDRFVVFDADIDEDAVPVGAPEDYCQQLAQMKSAHAALRFPDDIVIGCDTIVELDGAILGKPRDRDDAARMLRLLSGTTHRVYTGVCVRTPETAESLYCRTAVTFYPLSDAEIDAYIETGDPFDKAGAYGIQSGAAKFIESIGGDYFNVMGLPVSRLYRLLRDLGSL